MRFRAFLPCLILTTAATATGIYISASPIRISKTNFETSHPGFVEGNKRILQYRLAQPPSKLRNEVVNATRRNLEWASECERLGLDPDMYENWKFEQSLVAHNEPLR